MMFTNYSKALLLFSSFVVPEKYKQNFDASSEGPSSRSYIYRDLTILGRQRDDDGQNKLLQINGSKDNSSYIINRMNLIQS